MVVPSPRGLHGSFEEPEELVAGDATAPVVIASALLAQLDSHVA